MSEEMSVFIDQLGELLDIARVYLVLHDDVGYLNNFES